MVAAAPDAPEAGLDHRDAFGRYDLLFDLAAGGMATVYVARARGVAGFERLVAVKVCHPHLQRDPEFATMFLDEARLAAQIRHPNVIPTLDVGERPTLYLVMEYVEGDRLIDLIRAAESRGARVPAPIVLRIVLDALRGLHAAHELRDARGQALEIVHRDVSPQNVMVGADGVARIMDFGIAKASSRATVTRDGQVKGKLGYMPPEQLNAPELVNRRADVYACAVVLWEGLAGRRLFRGQTDSETINLVLRSAPAPIASLVPGMPAELDAVLATALASNPARRYPTAAAFAEALERFAFGVATGDAVARYVDEMLGETLRARRERVARRLDELAAAPARAGSEAYTAELHSSTPSPSRAVARGTAAPRSRAVPVAAAVVLLLAAGATAAALVARASAREHRSAPARTATVAPIVSPPSLPPPLPPPPSMPSAPTPVPSASSAAPHVARPHRAAARVSHGAADRGEFQPAAP